MCIKRIIALLTAGFTCLNSSAQLDNSFFSWKHGSEKPGTMTLHIENLNYFRNVEYRSPIDEGRTLFGLQFAPELSWQMDSNWLVSAGSFVKSDFGSARVNQWLATYQLKYSRDQLSFIFGRLEGNMDHGLIEPLLDPELIIEDRLENGFQFLMNRRRLDLDVWLDWKSAIYPMSNYREAFDAGITGSVHWLNRESFKGEVPFAILAHHKGGEIDTSGLPSVSQYTFCYGTTVEWIGRGRIKNLTGGVYFNNYEDGSSRPVSFIDGLGQYAFLGARWSEFGLMATYWDSHQFQAPNGDVYYQSMSLKNPQGPIFDYRKVWMFRGFFERDFGPELKLLARVNYIRDVHERQNDLVTEFYLRWSGFFRLNDRSTRQIHD